MRSAIYLLCLAVFCLTLAHAANDVGVWTKLNGSGSQVPLYRTGAAGALLNNSIVIFGGFTTKTGSSYLGDTWSYNLVTNTWASLASTDALSGHTAVSYQGSVYVFGGQDSTTSYNDIRKFSNGAWSTVSVTSPKPTARANHAAAVVGTDMYIFGGISSNIKVAELWKYSFTSGTWSDVTAVGPSARAYSTLVATNDGKLVLFGGETASGATNDVWVLSGGVWTQKAVSGPSARSSHSAVNVPGGFIVYGGKSGSTYFGDAWKYSFDDASWTAVSSSVAPTTRAGHTAVAVAGGFVVFGGSLKHGQADDLWQFTSGATLSQTAADYNGGRVNAAAAAFGGSVYVFGGFSNTSALLDDIVSYNTTSKAFLTYSPSTKPEARSYASLAPVSFGLVLFGGKDTTTTYNDVWVFEGGQWSKKTAPGAPTPRYGHSAVVYDSTSTIMIFGGLSSTNVYNSESYKYTQTLFGGVWELLTTSGNIPARAYHAAARSDSGIVVFGGMVNSADGVAPSNDLWILDITTLTWTQITSPDSWPEARYGHSMVAVPGGVLVYGGYSASDSALGDIWRYDLFEQSWTQLTDLSVVPRAYGVMASTGSSVVILGGSNDNSFVGLIQDLSIGRTVYVSTSGSDATGVGSSSAPYATIQQATMFASYGSIVLQAGTYKGYGQVNINPRSVVKVSAQGAVTIDCESSTNSRAFYATSSIPFALAGLTITKCSSGVVVAGARVRITNSVLSSNVGSSGAAATVVKGKLNIEDSTVSSNTANEEGGAIYAEDATLNIIRSTLTANTAKTGGAIYAENVKFAATDSIFRQNTATIGAGAAVVGGSAVLVNVTLDRNVATSSGGAVYSTDGASITITSSTATANTADLGGAAYVEGGQFTSNNFNASDNVANTAGGALYISLGSHSIVSSYFKANKAVSGAGLYIRSSTGSIQAGAFEQNQAQFGAGVYAGAKSSERFSSVTFKANNATKDGGALYASASQANATDSFFESNTAQRGAVFFSADSRILAINGVFTSNKASVGGAISFYDTVVPELTTPQLTANTAPYGILNATALRTLSVTSAPSGSQNASTTLPPIVIKLLDAMGQVITSDSSTVLTATITSSSKRAVVPTLLGTRTVQAVNGVITFNDLSVLADQGTAVSLNIGSGSLQIPPVSFVVSACQPGYKSEGGSCVACPAGSYRGAADAECTPCSAGSYAPNAGSASCTPCPAGQYQSLTGRSSCVFCDDGKSSSAGQSRCDDCPVGHYSNYLVGLAACTPCAEGFNASVAGSTICSACPAGTVAETTGSIFCEPCIAGQYTPTSGSTECSSCPPGSYSGDASPSCILCPAGTYSSLPGSPRCLECGYNRVTSKAGATSCVQCEVCPPGKKQDPTSADHCPLCVNCGTGYFSDKPNSQNCDPCPPGSFSSGYTATSCRLCPVGTYTTSTSSTVCIPCPSNSVTNQRGSTQCQTCPTGAYGNANRTQCVACPEGAQCVGHQALNSKIDWYGGPTLYQQCFAKDNCKGANKCAVGYSGPMCSVCTKDHGRLGTLCVSCITGYVAGAWILGVAMTIFFLVHMFLIGYDVRNAQITGKQIHPRATSVRILMNHLQILGWLAILKVRWSTPIQLWFYLFSAVPVMNLSNFALDCTRGLNFYEQFFFFMLLPIIVIVGSCIVFGIIYWALYGPGRGKFRDVVPHLITANAVIFRYILPIIMLEIWMAFDCIKLDSGKYLANDMREKCGTDENKAARGIGVVVFIIFVFGGPFAALCKLIYSRKNLRYDTVTNSLAFLWLGFKDNRFLYEFINYVKNIILIFFVILLRRYTNLEQFYSVTWLYIIVLFVFLYMRPYAYPLQNICEFLAILSQFGILITGIIYYDQGQDKKPTYVNVDGLFIALNTLVIMVLVAVIYFVHPLNQKLMPVYAFMKGKNDSKSDMSEPLKEKEKGLDHNNIVLRVMADGPPASSTKKGYEDNVSSSDAYSYTSSRASRSSRSRTSRSRSRSPYSSEDDEVRRRSRSPDSRSSSRTSASRTDSEAPEGRSRRRSLSIDSRSSDGSNSSASSEYRRTGAGGRKRSSSASSGSTASSEYGGRNGAAARKRSYSDSSSSSESSSSDEAELRRGPKDDDMATPLRPAPPRSSSNNNNKRESTSNYQDMNIGQLINNIEKLLGDEDK